MYGPNTSVNSNRLYSIKWKDSEERSNFLGIPDILSLDYRMYLLQISGLALLLLRALLLRPLPFSLRFAAFIFCETEQLVAAG